MRSCRPFLVLLLACAALPGCVIRREAAAPPPVYSQASPYAPGAAAPQVQAIAPAPGSYCEEAVGEAQDAAAIAAGTGSPRDQGRARRTADYAARDCR